MHVSIDNEDASLEAITNHARKILTDAGVDLLNPDYEFINQSPLLHNAAIVAGIMEFDSADKFLKDAENDPILWMSLTDKERAVCKDRARLAMYCIVGSDDGGLQMTKDDIAFVEALMLSEGDPLKAAKVLFEAAISLSRDTLLKDAPSRRSQAPVAARLWIKEYTKIYFITPGVPMTEIEKQVSDFYKDGQPPTSLRLVAMDAANREIANGSQTAFGVSPTLN